MITLSTIPNIVLSRDPLPVDFATSNFKLTTGAKAVYSFRLVDLPSTNDTLTITINGVEHVFTCKLMPDDSGYQFSEPTLAETIGNDVAGYVGRALRPALLANYYINSSFAVTGAGDTIILTALDEKYQTIAATASGFTLAISVGNTAGANATYRENFKINYQIVDAITHAPITSPEALEPDANGEVTIDISEFLQGLAINSFNLNSNNLYYELSTAHLKRVYLRCWESYGINPVTVLKNTKTTDFYVMEAASSWIEQARLNEYSQWWYDGQLTNKFFLTKMPRERNVLPGQKVLLHYLHLDTGGGLILKIKLFINGVEDDLLFYNVPYAGANKLYQFDVSPEKLGLNSDITSYQVWCENSIGNTVSEMRTFTIDKNYYNNIRFFFFRNALGGYDTIQALGSGTVEESYTRERTTVQIPPRFKVTDRETRIVNIDQQLSFKANLGFMNLQGEGRDRWANAIRQLYSSFEAYEIINGELYPIDIIRDKQRLLDDDNYLPDFFEMEYTRAYIEKGAPSDVPQLEGAYSQQYSPQYAGGNNELTETENQLQ